VTLDSGEVGDGRCSQPGLAFTCDPRMTHTRVGGIDATFDESGVGHAGDDASARRGADEQAYRELAHRRLPTCVVKLKEHVVPGEWQSVTLEQLAIEAAGEGEVGTQKPLPRGQCCRARAVASGHAARVPARSQTGVATSGTVTASGNFRICG
jgi:hypothetical protein